MIGQKYIYGISLDPKVPPVEVGRLVTGIEAVDQQSQQLIPFKRLPHPHVDGRFLKVFRVPDTVETGNRRHHNHIVPSGEQRRGSSQTKFFNLVVDGKILLNIGIGGGNVGFGLIVIVIGNEVLHRVVRKEAFKLTVELRRQCFVVA
ncbi:hypothetical protein SDC9_190305 [bioreactor metagenome]|uniref:Uncharacterized protein n=1 Tax=bioreactor metagenome TaxID=1076179 RepID=A0A645HUP9_9ZZZZ